MAEMKYNPECLVCKARKYIVNAKDLPEKQKFEYISKIAKIISEVTPNSNQIDINKKIEKVVTKYYGPPKDFTEIKKHFNNLLLSKSEYIQNEINKADDSLYRALQLALVGNYIDFVIFDSVDEKKLEELIQTSVGQIVNIEVYQRLKKELSQAQELIYITDNCGEVVFDKFCIQEIQKEFPNLHVCALVRGANVANDANMDDAKQIGLIDICEVIDNGTDYTGTELNLVPEYVLKRLKEADLIIAKGQGNAETLDGCGLNIFYAFLCKCKVYAQKYHGEVFHGILHAERSA